MRPPLSSVCTCCANSVAGGVLVIPLPEQLHIRLSRFNLHFVAHPAFNAAEIVKTGQMHPWQFGENELKGNALCVTHYESDLRSVVVQHYRQVT